MKHLHLFESFGNAYYGITDFETMSEILEETYGDLTQTALNPACQQMADAAVRKLNQYTKFVQPHILWSQEDELEAVGLYVHSSALNSEPVIILFEKVLQDLSNGSARELRHGIDTTIYHEMIHALVDVDDAYLFLEDDNVLHYEDEEDYVETIARDYYAGHNLPDEVQTLCDLFQQKQWLDINEEYDAVW